jgi:hypothetical protein
VKKSLREQRLRLVVRELSMGFMLIAILTPSPDRAGRRSC